MPSADSTWDLQKALYAALVANSALTAKLGDGIKGVYDDVTEQAKKPYITIGDIPSQDWGTNTEKGMEHFPTVNVWTDRNTQLAGGVEYEGRKLAREIIQLVYDTLHEATLTIPGFANVNLRFRFSGVTRDEENTYHGFINFRAVTEPA